MTELNDFVQIEKPTFNDYKYLLKLDLEPARLDKLVELLPRMSSVSVSTMLHPVDLDQFCRDMFRLWGDYVNIEVWFDDAEEGLNLLELLDVKAESFRVRETQT
ncbi:hypothetical protein GCM10011332_31620 [Terasakiella brassicae]|uniref:Uncharacterized protein n=1 Tax=Terasakiella brassicae TaxID=1634917 RepID=A0A917C864_9PROT|nr:hypothetical protein [Terasakiella brassicae]GGF75308.1 hypothetical protein GCM10011332_31620 [Terasakiella brassicae]